MSNESKHIVLDYMLLYTICDFNNIVHVMYNVIQPVSVISYTGIFYYAIYSSRG